MKPGDKVVILIDTVMGLQGMEGIIHDKNFTNGLISVALKDVYNPDQLGPILDFHETHLKLKSELEPGE